MPFYEVIHHCPLTLSQQEELATAITDIHSEKFGAMRNFVNVGFKPLDADAPRYVAGKQQTSNMIFAWVRTGPSRTLEDWNDLVAQTEAAWTRICGTPVVQAKGRMQGDTTLRGVFVMGDLIAGAEAGFVIPKAGEDAKWMRDNWKVFQKRADAGEVEFQEMIADAKARGMAPEGVNGH